MRLDLPLTTLSIMLQMGRSRPCRSASSRATRGRLHALGHHVHLGQDVLELAALAQLLAHRPVAAVRAHAGGDQVAHAGQPGERRRLRPPWPRRAGELGQATRHDGGPGVVAHAEALADAGGDGDHVLQGAAHSQPMTSSLR